MITVVSSCASAFSVSVIIVAIIVNVRMSYPPTNDLYPYSAGLQVTELSDK